MIDRNAVLATSHDITEPTDDAPLWQLSGGRATTRIDQRVDVRIKLEQRMLVVLHKA